MRYGQARVVDLACAALAEGRSPLVYTAAGPDDPAVLGFADVPVRGTTYRVFSLQSPAQVIQVAQNLQVRRQMARMLAWRTVWPLSCSRRVSSLPMWPVAPMTRVVGIWKLLKGWVNGCILWPAR